MNEAEYGGACLLFPLLLGLRWDSLCGGVQGQPGQHSETMSQQINAFTKTTPREGNKGSHSLVLISLYYFLSLSPGTQATPESSLLANIILSFMTLSRDT